MARVFVVVACMFLCGSALAVKAAGDEQAQVSGVWRGHSVCTVENSPCHDEVNVYRISAIAGKPGEFLVSADKIVDGKEVVMGSSEWKYESGTHSLAYQFSRGTFRLNLDGDKMEGDLRLPDGTVYRRIYLQKEK